MTEKEINEQLNLDYDNFLYSKYEGKVPIPTNIIELFKKAVFVVPPYGHKVFFTKIKAIASTPINKLTNGDLNDVIKLVLSVPLEKLYPDLTFEKIIENGIAMDRFVLEYNNQIEECKQRLNQKKVVLKNLTTGLPRNGMRIIPQA